MPAQVFEEAQVLIVDDDPDARIILTRMFKIIGWESAAVKNGQEALTFIEQTPPTMILLDLMMPHMSGFEVLTRLKGNPTTRNIPVIIISALGADQRLKRLGASVVLPKGEISVEKLKRAVDIVLEPLHRVDSSTPTHLSA